MGPWASLFTGCWGIFAFGKAELINRIVRCRLNLCWIKPLSIELLIDSARWGLPLCYSSPADRTPQVPAPAPSPSAKTTGVNQAASFSGKV